MKKETLIVTWKRIIRKGYGRTPKTYCVYIMQNEEHRHRRRVEENTLLFDILSKTVVSAHLQRYEKQVVIDGVYYDNKLIRVENPRIL
jgi:hypothetical protein